MKRILVTGASGRVGRHVVRQLAETGLQVRALFRNSGAAGLPANVEAVQGDLTDAESLQPHVEDIDCVFLVWNAPGSAAPAALERLLSHATGIVFLSSPYTIDHPFFQRAQPNPVSLLHAEIERLIRKSGREAVFLRPGMFSANAAWWWSEQIRAGDVVRWPCAQAPSAPIDERDIASVAVRALCGGVKVDFEQLLTGPESLTNSQQVAAIGEVLGRALRYEEISAEEFRTRFPAGAADMLLKAWGGAMEQPAMVTTAVSDLTGCAPRRFSEWASDHADQFR